jgi:hypothetical protein
MAKRCAAVLLAALAGLPASADEIRLANGRKLEGIVLRKTDAEVEIEVGAGRITLSSKDVSSINPGRTALHELAERLEAVRDSRRAEDHYALAAWAKGRGLTQPVEGLCLRALELDPEHAGARAMLRHEKKDGRWLTFEQAQEARGLVWMDDRWVTPAQVVLAQRQRLEAAERRRTADEERKRRQDEERERRERAQAEAEERWARATEGLDGYFYSPSFAFTTPYFRPYPWATYLRSRRFYQEGWRIPGYQALPYLRLWP